MTQDSVSANQDNFEKTRDWYDTSYGHEGFGAQRLYPNEELLRFFGRNLFHLNAEQRQATSVLEVGCGSCSNLWMIAKEGFDAYGIDLSAEAIKLGEQMLKHWRTSANLSVGKMTKLPYGDSKFDVVCDVLSSCCLDMTEFNAFLAQLNRVLKSNGTFFSYTFSAQSDAFSDFLPAQKIDEYTLNGIYREDSPFYGNFYPVRFSDPKVLTQQLEKHGFRVERLELVTKTYNNMKENFQFISLEASK